MHVTRSIVDNAGRTFSTCLESSSSKPKFPQKKRSPAEAHGPRQRRSEQTASIATRPNASTRAVAAHNNDTKDRDILLHHIQGRFGQVWGWSGRSGSGQLMNCCDAHLEIHRERSQPQAAAHLRSNRHGIQAFEISHNHECLVPLCSDHRESAWMACSQAIVL